MIHKHLRELAKTASTLAYSPYSNALVGSAVETANGTIFSGSNIENSSYGATICAERVAIFKAIASGHREIRRIYVYSKDGWPPCGMCRQVIAEFATPDCEVIIGNASGDEKRIPFKEIMPLAFTPEHLK